MAHDFLRYVADDETLDAGPAMRCQDDEIGHKVLRAVKDRLKRIAIADGVSDFAVVLHDIMTELFEQDFRVILGGAQDFGAPLWFGRICVNQRRISLGDLGQVNFVEGIVNHMENIERRSLL